MITASSLARVLACPGSEALPHINRTSEFAEAGTVRHWFLENVGKIGVANALVQIPEKHREMCEAIDLEGLPTDLASEVAFAWNWETGEVRELGRGLNRDYSDCKSTEIAGTIDAVGVSADSLYLGDYKGFAPVKARDNAQLLFAALCATQVYGRDTATVEIINIRNGSNWRSKASVDAFDLGDFEDKLRNAIATVRLQEGPPYEVTEGDHCKYCPAFDSCPSKTALLRKMVGIDDVEMVPITAENAAEIYSKWLAMKSLMSKATAAVMAYASERPIQLGDGRVFGAREKKGNEKIDGDAAYVVIRNRLGQKAADMAVSRNATKSGIAKAVKQAKDFGDLTGTLKAENDSILTELRGDGAVTRKTSTTIDEHKAALPAPARIPLGVPSR